MKTIPQPLEPVTPANGHSANGEHTNENGQHKAGSFGVLLEEAQSLQNTLRDMLLRHEPTHHGPQAIPPPDQDHAQHSGKPSAAPAAGGVGPFEAPGVESRGLF